MTVSHRLGVDFGTSNSAAGYLQGGTPRLIQVEPGKTTLPTAFFFDFDSRATLTGSLANAALLAGDEGRYMRALKRVLGTSLMHETRQILNERVTFVDIIARFLREIKQRAEADSGLRFDRVLSGRPVQFHSDDAARNARAEDDLRQCYLAAGFNAVDFLYEPEAAALATQASRENPAASGVGTLGLVVDIGGGTSDFSLFEVTDGKAINIIANQGVTIGGTDFDRVLSMDHIMPHMGKSSHLRNEFGPGTLAAPNRIFNDLATWEKIPFQYNAKTRAMVADMVAKAVEPDKMRRLATLLSHELGHELAFAVERGKIAVNSLNAPGDGASARIDLNFIDTGFSAELSPPLLEASLHMQVAAITASALECVKVAGIAPDRVDQIVFVGGSSLLSVVCTAIQAAFPNAKPIYSEVFTAVADGLAIAASAQD